MGVKHERDINWSDDVFTLPRNADINDEPIKVYFESNMMREGGSYAVWHEKEIGGAPVEDGLSMSRAKRRAKKLQEKHGSPIIETVEKL
jgi:hypothetical protein